MYYIALLYFSSYIILYYIVLYYTILCFIISSYDIRSLKFISYILYYIIFYSIISYHIMISYHIISYRYYNSIFYSSFVLYSIIIYYITSYCIILKFITIYYSILFYYAISYCIRSWKIHMFNFPIACNSPNKYCIIPWPPPCPSARAEGDPFEGIPSAAKTIAERQRRVTLSWRKGCSLVPKSPYILYII